MEKQTKITYYFTVNKIKTQGGVDRLIEIIEQNNYTTTIMKKISFPSIKHEGKIIVKSKTKTYEFLEFKKGELKK